MIKSLKVTTLQQGATLAVTLILLFVVSLLGISAMHVTQMQEKMSSNLQDKELSFSAAESALMAGEEWLLGLTTQPPVVTTCSSFPCVQTILQNTDITAQTSSWWNSNAATYNTDLEHINSSPKYIIEFLEFIPDSLVIGDSSIKSTGVFYYQITSRGTGSSDESVTILQTTLGRRF
ncbi:pilus assembly PilX family protein [Legionella yabuuchiae]|uniref:pilus assembly PilX family protein n=1 Tax=Legionella yabuuchiae TaxID=376727 RepID=UPI0013EF80DD|nr:PilX N-terminal domain-containing pilus assembly protein [Legionella yabuuchiae]